MGAVDAAVAVAVVEGLVPAQARAQALRLTARSQEIFPVFYYKVPA